MIDFHIQQGVLSCTSSRYNYKVSVWLRAAHKLLVVANVVVSRVKCCTFDHVRESRDFLNYCVSVYGVIAACFKFRKQSGLVSHTCICQPSRIFGIIQEIQAMSQCLDVFF